MNKYLKIPRVLANITLSDLSILSKITENDPIYLILEKISIFINRV